VELAVDAEGDAAAVDAVMADAELGVAVCGVGAGFGAGLVRDRGCRLVWE
jgi:hypothetical protein